MSSLKQLRDRIGSVKGTQKITRAMQMVAASKLRRAQENLEASQPYLKKILETASCLNVDGDCPDTPLIVKGSNKDCIHLLVVCTSERGLCGAFNSQIIRNAILKLASLLKDGKEVKIFAIGKKAIEYFDRHYLELVIERVSFRDRKQIEYAQAYALGEKIIALYDQKKFDTCTLFYSKFRSILVQEPTSIPLIPLVSFLDLNKCDVSKQNVTKKDIKLNSYVYEFEPTPCSVLEKLAPIIIFAKIFSVLLENLVGEMGSKMRAMDNATRNAGEMIQKLSVTYNRRRQAQITTELIEIIAGAEAL